MMKQQIGKRLGFIVIGLGAAALLQMACTKPADSAVLNLTKTDETNQPVNSTIRPSKVERITQIDVQLASWVPTGRPDDADRRSALRAERAALAASSGLQFQTSQQSRPVANTPPPMMQPRTTPTTIVVAPATSHNADPMDPETRRQLNITSAGGHYDRTTRRIEPNATPWQ